ncbi:c-type cytochrome [Sinorhizobium numidicum]|uniref:C-type cytochrome n=1 Tax=Sinorhizobium numidicum TaxID=680248 RepID=A0ABY8CQK8_9HYPH|nr:c-type cytochrome [Sinorhizobium numidicum]WEX74462.1 c-type cytochrome [Sinorhizobium numidicum]WEX80452.1 c-type cytochrome [Sinorhizobium numidicum]
MKNTHLTSAFVLSVLLCPGVSRAQEPAAPEGERLFRTRCASCHSLNMGENRMGPHLSGLVGRTAGSVEGARYSKALGASGFVWDEERLAAYLNNPRQVVPGTTMSVSIRDETQRSAIISYLRSFSTDGEAVR